MTVICISYHNNHNVPKRYICKCLNWKLIGLIPLQVLINYSFKDYKVIFPLQSKINWLLSFIIRWSVENRSPIVFVRIFFLYLFIYLLLLLLLGGLLKTDHLLFSSEFSFFIYYYYYYLFLFLPVFCLSVNSRSVVLISFNFDTVISHCHETWQEHFQGHQVIVTSSRRHFVKSRYPSYLHDASAKVIHIYITYISGQGSTGHVIKGHIKVTTRAYVRVKI